MTPVEIQTLLKAYSYADHPKMGRSFSSDQAIENLFRRGLVTDNRGNGVYKTTVEGDSAVKLIKELAQIAIDLYSK